MKVLSFRLGLSGCFRVFLSFPLFSIPSRSPHYFGFCPSGTPVIVCHTVVTRRGLTPESLFLVCVVWNHDFKCSCFWLVLSLPLESISIPFLGYRCLTFLSSSLSHVVEYVPGTTPVHPWPVVSHSCLLVSFTLCGVSVFVWRMGGEITIMVEIRLIFCSLPYCPLSIIVSFLIFRLTIIDDFFVFMLNFVLIFPLFKLSFRLRLRSFTRNITLIELYRITKKTETFYFVSARWVPSRCQLSF